MLFDQMTRFEYSAIFFLSICHLIIIGKKTFGLIAINGFLCIHVSEIYLIRSFVFVEGSLRLSVSFGAKLYYFYEILIIVH